MANLDIVKPENLVYERTKVLTDATMHYCPGCGHGTTHRIVAEVIDELGIQDKTVGVAPVGCSVLAYNYFDVDFQEAAHGRAPALATAVKRLNPDLNVFTYQGDGDLAAIGTAETIHAANRGENITMIFVNNGIYAGQAPYMFYQLITTEQNADTKLVYFNDMMGMFDQRLARLDSINSFNKVKNTKGDVLAVRADYYNYTAPTIGAACNYNFKTHYGNYAEAIKEIKENGGRDVEGSVLQNFILISDAYFKQVPSHREQYLQDYLDAKDACEKMLALATEANAEGDTARAQQLLQKYDAPLAQIETTFATSGAAEREQVIALYEKTIESKKDDLNYLRSAITLMSNADCNDADIYYKACEYAYAIEPTFESAIGMGEFELKNGNMNKMVEYYNLDAVIDKNIMATNTANFINERLAVVTLELDTVEQAVEDYMQQNDLNVVVINFIDMLSHARTESKMVRELANNESAYRSISMS